MCVTERCHKTMTPSSPGTHIKFFKFPSLLIITQSNWSLTVNLLYTPPVTAARFSCPVSLLLPEITASGGFPVLLTLSLLPNKPSPETQWDKAAASCYLITQPSCLKLLRSVA